jgi:NAD+ kinase
VNIALYGHTLRPEYNTTLRHFFSFLAHKNVTVTIAARFSHVLKTVFGVQHHFLEFQEEQGLPAETDVLVSLGGDGTTLGAALLVKDSGIPILGLNLGRLGFLASIPPEQLEEALEQVLARNYRLDPRTLVGVTTEGQPFGPQAFALNEITVLKKDSSSMVTIQCWIDDEFFNAYWADGLIVSTPTGSTGYSLSCGGPILLPQSPSLVLTPIAPHNLNVRPVVIPDTSTIRLNVTSRTSDFLVSLDSRSFHFSEGKDLTLQKMRFHVNFIQLASNSFTETLRNKLLWGVDKRN